MKTVNEYKCNVIQSENSLENKTLNYVFVQNSDVRNLLWFKTLNDIKAKLKVFNSKVFVNVFATVIKEHVTIMLV